MLISVLQCLSDFSVDHPIWTSVLTVFLTAQFCKWMKSMDKRLPPGPLGLPVVGYLPFLLENAHQELAKWQQTYGSVFSLNVGLRNVVVLGDFKSVREANLDEAFSGNARCTLKVAGRTKHFEAMNPRDRKESCNFTRNTLKKLALGGNKFEAYVTEEVTRLVERLEQTTGRSEFHLPSIIRPSLISITRYLIFGLRDGQNLDFCAALYDFLGLSKARFGGSSISYFLPHLSPLISKFSDPKGVIKRNLNELTRLISKEIENHEARFQPTSLEDYIDYFLAEMKTRIGDPSTFTKGNLTGNCLLLASSGVETTSASIEWVLLLMAQHQDIQERVHQEIVDNWGQTSWPDWKDMKPLPYLESVLMEAERWKTTTPLGTPHMTLTEGKVNHYDIPEGALIINNIQSIHMDPELWDEPEVFNPERFLTPDKKTTHIPDFFMPLSYGLRTCPGEEIAKMEVVTIVAAILQRFKILPPSSGLNMDENLCGLVLTPASPYLKVQARNGN